MQILKIFMYTIHVIASIVLVALVVMQSSKSEGLGAVGGGGSGPSMRGRAGMEEKLGEYTRYAAIAFMVLSALLYMFATKFGWT
jgi:preprotein translocase subunit SecG